MQIVKAYVMETKSKQSYVKLGLFQFITIWIILVNYQIGQIKLIILFCEVSTFAVLPQWGCQSA